MVCFRGMGAGAHAVLADALFKTEVASLADEKQIQNPILSSAISTDTGIIGALYVLPLNF